MFDFVLEEGRVVSQKLSKLCPVRSDLEVGGCWRRPVASVPEPRRSPMPCAAMPRHAAAARQ